MMLSDLELHSPTWEASSFLRVLICGASVHLAEVTFF